MASKLIYAEDLITAIRDDPYIHGRAYARTRDHIDEAKAVDAVEVVRCKDCKHCIYISYACGDVRCGKLHTDYIKEGDFCSYGERREGE